MHYSLYNITYQTKPKCIAFIRVKAVAVCIQSLHDNSPPPYVNMNVHDGSFVA